MDERPDVPPAGLRHLDEPQVTAPPAGLRHLDEPEVTDPTGPEVAAPAPAEAAAVEELDAEIEIVDALPVVSSRRELTRAAAALPAVQTAAAAATGFMVGAATLALLRRRDSRQLSRELRDLRWRTEPRRPPEPPLEPGQSYLVHVRVFSRPPLDPRN